MRYKREGYKTLNARGALKSGRILIANFTLENVTNCRVTICRSPNPQ
jgi:hypothetical protein